MRCVTLLSVSCGFAGAQEAPHCQQLPWGLCTNSCPAAITVWRNTGQQTLRWFVWKRQSCIVCSTALCSWLLLMRACLTVHFPQKTGTVASSGQDGLATTETPLKLFSHRFLFLLHLPHHLGWKMKMQEDDQAAKVQLCIPS